MAKPSDSELFATDATFAADGDAWSGDPTRLDAGAARRAEGFEPDTLPAEWVNHQLGVLGDHVDYIHNVLDATDIIPAVDRVVVINASDFQLAGAAGADWDAAQGTTGVSTSIADVGLAHLDLRAYVPHGAIVKRVKILVDPGIGRATVGNRISLQMQTRTLDFSTPAAGASSADFTLVRDDGTAGLQVLDSGAFTTTIDSVKTHEITVTAGNDAATNNDVFYGVELTFTDPGPRNF